MLTCLVCIVSCSLESWFSCLCSSAVTCELDSWRVLELGIFCLLCVSSSTELLTSFDKNFRVPLLYQVIQQVQLVNTNLVWLFNGSFVNVC